MSKDSRFATQFWGDKGFENVTKRLEEGQKSSELFCHFVSERAQLEKDYAQRMKRLAKNAEKIKEVGTSKEMQKLKDYLERVRQMYMKCSQAAEHAELKVNQLKASNGRPKDVNKAMSELSKMAKEAMKHEKEYQDSVTRLAAFQVEYVEKMSGVLEFLQIQEEQRIEHVREKFIAFVEVQDAMAPALGAANQRIKTAVQRIDKNKDVREFVSSFGTGNAKPPAPTFEPYKKKNGGTGFSVPTAQAAAPARGAPPAAKSGGQRSFQARAVYDYVAQDHTELNMRAGDIVTIVATDSSGWWTALKGSSRGLVPSNYVLQT